MNGNNDNRRADLAADIRRQMGTEATKRFLRTMPEFRLQEETPKQLKDLLDRLDEVQSGGGRRQ
jgi:hypothetical protein